MGIYIPGMEMPTTCFECSFMFARRYCRANLTLDLYQGNYDEIKGRVDGCPLVPIPKHGRLGDLDELLDRAFGCLGEETFLAFQFLVNGSVTIIPADKEGEG